MHPAIRLFKSNDWPTVRDIYEEGLLTRNATFETTMPDYDQWLQKFNSNLLWVAIDEEQVVGWAGLQPVSMRKVYEGVMEVTIYVYERVAGKGVGSALMNHLVTESENAGVWTLYASIFPENVASIRLHLKHGFREIGYRERIAQLDGKWRNTILFERRSKIIGN